MISEAGFRGDEIYRGSNQCRPRPGDRRSRDAAGAIQQTNTGARAWMSSSTNRSPKGTPFYRLENVLLSPHCADHTAEWKNDAMRFFLKQYARFEKAESLKNVVNKQLGY